MIWGQPRLFETLGAHGVSTLRRVLDHDRLGVEAYGTVHRRLTVVKHEILGKKYIAITASTVVTSIVPRRGPHFAYAKVRAPHAATLGPVVCTRVIAVDVTLLTISLTWRQCHFYEIVPRAISPDGKIPTRLVWGMNTSLKNL